MRVRWRWRNKMLKNAIFLDRDGVINRDSDQYIKTWEEFEFLPGSLDALSLLTKHGVDIFIITNQSILGRGIIPPETLVRTHRLMGDVISAHGGVIRDIFFCPHTPEEGCDCRKPAPGLIFQARDRYGIDLASAVMVGDNAKDMECARNAGCGKAVLVKTGNGLSAEGELSEKRIFPDHVAEDLLAAARWILGSFP